MKSSLYSLYDIKAEFYSKPFVSQNDDTAIRMIQNAFRDSQAADSEYRQNPQDFRLKKIADWDDSIGLVKPELKPILDLTSIQQEQSDEIERV